MSLVGVFDVHVGKNHFFLLVVIAVEGPWWFSYPTYTIIGASLGAPDSSVTYVALQHPLYWLLNKRMK